VQKTSEREPIPSLPADLEPVNVGSRGGQWALALAILGVFVCAGCGGGKLSAEALSKQAEALQSVAAEGALLGQDAGAGKTTRTFAREHADDLYKVASKEEASLRTATTEPSLESKLRRLTVVARETSAALKQLGDAPEGEQRQLGARLTRAADELERIIAGL